MARKSSKCSHQSSGESENAVRKTYNSAKSCDCVLPDRFDCQVNSDGIVPPWDVGCVTHVLNLSEKRDDDYNVRESAQAPWAHSGDVSNFCNSPSSRSVPSMLSIESSKCI